MLAHEVTSLVGRDRLRRRVGRGRGSGRGKTCGRGHKGSLSRAGASLRPLYEGGQMPLFRRLPKRGFSNYKFVTRYQIVNVSQLERFSDDSVVGLEQLSQAGLIDISRARVKILGSGQLTKRLEVTADKFSRSAEQKILACGGKATLARRGA